ncbi:MAG: hypothetical protein QXH37_07465, partial [Candidatus Bathyarchaeia archaeon]
MPIDLTTKFVGIELKNPIIVGSAHNIATAEHVKKAADAGAAAVVMKTAHEIIPREKRRPSLLAKTSVRNLTNDYDPRLTKRGVAFSLMAGALGTFYIDDIAKEIKKAKKMVDIPIIGSIAAETVDEYGNLARMMDEAGADAIEFPDPAHYKKPFRFEIVKVIKENTSLPIIAKLPEAWEDPVEVSKKWKEAGVDAVTALGETSLMGLEIDVETAEPLFGGECLMYGTWMRPVSLYYVARIRQSVGIPVAGVTGVLEWKGAVQYLLVGAEAVQMSSAIFARGWRVLDEVVKGIREYMERKGYSKIDDFKG